MNDPYSNEHQRIEAQTKFHYDSTAAQLIYNQKMMDLETQLSKNMIHEVNERGQILQQRIDAQNRNSLQSKFDTLNADVTSVDNVKEQVDNQNEINAAVARRNILGNTRLNQQQKELELERINADLSLKNTNAELG